MTRFVCVVSILLASFVSRAESGKNLLLRKPALSRTQIVFSYAGDLWSVPREGGEARRLTAGPGVETDPVFSPDGSQIAFTGEYDGNVDVCRGRSGGVPKRLTYHPGQDAAVGWTPDGKRILFVSSRAIPNDGASCSPCRWKAADCRTNCRCRSRWKDRIRRTVRTWRTCRCFSGRRPGSGIAAGRRARSGSPNLADSSMWRKFRARIRTTSTPCGWATKSTFSPTATAR